MEEARGGGGDGDDAVGAGDGRLGGVRRRRAARHRPALQPEARAPVTCRGHFASRQVEIVSFFFHEFKLY